jgi:oligoribonuclease
MNFPILDLETTGLLARPGAILEVSMVVMDTSFNVIQEYTSVVRHWPCDIENLLSDFAKKKHTESGLLAECYVSNKTLNRIEDEVISIIDQHFGKNEKPILTGNSIHFDRRFIIEWMPSLHARLNYRMLDVSALWEWAKMFRGIERPDLGVVAHRGLPDARGSAMLLREFGYVVKT